MRFVHRLTAVKWLVLLAVGGFLSAFACNFVNDAVRCRQGARDGLDDAESDIAEGKLKLLIAGKPPCSREHVQLIFRERCNLMLEYVGGCSPSAYRRAYNSAYNERMGQAVQAQIPGFSIGSAYESVRQEADKRYEAESNRR